MPEKFRRCETEELRLRGLLELAPDAMVVVDQAGVIVSLSPIETPDGMLVVSAIRDVSERKLAEESRFRLAAIVESSEDAIISKTLDGVIVSWNKGAQQIYGYTEAEAVGKPSTILADFATQLLETFSNTPFQRKRCIAKRMRLFDGGFGADQCLDTGKWEAPVDGLRNAPTVRLTKPSAGSGG